MAKKKQVVEIPPPEPAQLGVEPADLEPEERRRYRNQRRFHLRSRSWHDKWMEIVREKEPDTWEDLQFWRRYNPQEFRKRLVRWCEAHGVYDDHLYTSRELPPLDVRREEG